MDQRLFRINGWKLIVVLRMEFMEGLMFFHYAFFGCLETGTAYLPLKINSLCFSQMRFILGLIQKFFKNSSMILPLPYEGTCHCNFKNDFWCLQILRCILKKWRLKGGQELATKMYEEIFIIVHSLIICTSTIFVKNFWMQF